MTLALNQTELDAITFAAAALAPGQRVAFEQMVTAELSLLPEAGSRPRRPASDHYHLSEDLPSRWGDCCWPKPC
jgi:hypothetical protein